MFFGNQQITRQDMPSFNWKDADPNYMYSSFQDVYKNNNAMPMVQPNMTTQESGSIMWEK